MTTPALPDAVAAAAEALGAAHDKRGWTRPQPWWLAEAAEAMVAAAGPVIRAEADRKHSSLRGRYAQDLHELRQEIANLRAALREAGAEMDRRYEMGAAADMCPGCDAFRAFAEDLIGGDDDH